MSALPKVSVRVDGSMAPAACVELAKAAESAGFSGIWFAENAFARGILPTAAACAMATQTLRINAGVFNPYSRHPTMMAMEIGALDEMSGGRASISIGAGVMSATEKMGFSTEKPVLAVRDAVTIVRGLLRGEEVSHEGSIFSAKKIKLDYRPRGDIPIFVAGRGNLTVKLAGEAADGLVISNMCSVGFAGRVTELMKESRGASGGRAAVSVVQYMPCSVRPSEREALNAAKEVVGEMLPRFWALGQKLGSAKEALLVGTGITEEELSHVARRLREGEYPVQVLEDRYARAFSLVGTPQQCIEAAQRYRAAGVTELALTFSGPKAAQDIAALGQAMTHGRFA